ncbi:MAG: hypothetical protein ACREMV_11830 [Gemmatimonadales bacterium]
MAAHTPDRGGLTVPGHAPWRRGPGVAAPPRLFPHDLPYCALRNRARMYIDPGYGALLLQGLLAGLVGVGFVLRQKIGALVNAILRRKPTPGGDE